MTTVIRIETTVSPDGTIEIRAPELVPGKHAQVTIEIEDDEQVPESLRAIDILEAMPGHLEFQTAEEVDAYLKEERDSWER